MPTAGVIANNFKPYIQLVIHENDKSTKLLLTISTVAGNDKNGHYKERSNPKLYRADLLIGDCFVPRNDGFEGKNLTSSRELSKEG